MQIGSFLDNKLTEKVIYSYHKRGLDELYHPDEIKEYQTLDAYSSQNGNLFFHKAVGWQDSELLQGGIDIRIKLWKTCFVDHIELEQMNGSALDSIEVFSMEGESYRKIGNLASQTGKMITDKSLTIPIGYFCDSVVIRLNGNCMPVKIKTLDILGAWDLENCIYPFPQKITYKENFILLSDFKVIQVGNEDEEFAAKYLCEKLRDKVGYAPEIVTDSECCKGNITLKIGKTGLRDSFEIDINSEYCLLKALNRLSLIYAVDALLQCINGTHLRACHIEDEAFMELRGVHLALPARKDIEFLKNMVKHVFVPMRYNTVYLQISGAMEYEKYPEINQAWLECNEKYEKGEWPMPAHYGFIGKDVLTKKEVQDLCEYMNAFGLEVVPEVQAWGHTQYITMAYPHLAEKTDAAKKDVNIVLNTEDIAPDSFYYHTMCPLHEEYYNVIFGVLDEVLEVVKPKRFVHMGHDEIYDVGKCSKCSEIPNYKLYIDEVTKLNDYIKSKNLTMMIWADMLQNQRYSAPFAINQIPKDIIMLDFVWYFHVDEDIEDNLLSHGFQVILGNMYSSHYPRFESRARKPNIRGAEVSTWIPCDEFSYGFHGKIFDFVYSAQCMWSEKYDSRMRLTYYEIIKPILADIRLKIGNLKPGSVTKHIKVQGKKTNIPYDIRDLVNYNSAVAANVLCPEVEIPVNDYGEILTFVHATDKGSHRIMWKEPIKIGEYVLLYEDGSEYRDSLFYAGNIHKYLSSYGVPMSASFFRHEGYVGTYLTIPECGKNYNGEDYTLGKYSIRNPYTLKKIKSIKLRHECNTDAAILLFDLTLNGAVEFYAGFQTH